MATKRRGKPATWPEIRAFRTLLRAEHRVLQEHKRLEKSLDLSLSQVDVLLALGGTEGMRMGALAERCITSPANVTRVCTTLEELGLVQRQRSEESDRVVVASVTPEGQRLFEEYFPRTAAFTSGIFSSVLSEEECTQLADLLDKLARAEGPPEP